MADKSWKDHLLKSGLPFEYEVKECFAKHGCTVWDEYSYVKNDENNIEKEFSYDIDVNYWSNHGDSFSFMIECKYKTEPTKWFFLPDPYSYQREVTPNSFLHPIDYFKEGKFIFNSTPYSSIQEPLGPFCLKGVEIYQNQYLEANIFKAINQLSFAFIEQVIQSIDSQLETESFYETTFFNIPVIITNADLYLINEQLTTAEIEKANNIEEISKKHDFLLFHHKSGEALKRYNESALKNYFKQAGIKSFAKKKKSFATDLPHFINVLSQHYSPQVILIMHHDDKHENYQKLFDYIDFMINPSEELKARIKKVKEDWDYNMKNFFKKNPPIK